MTEAELRQRETKNITAALENCNWKTYGPDGAAAKLGLKPTTLRARIKKMGIKRMS
jgi:transcriptional regulator with GAF, ATPase, and Fis domain